MNSLTYAGKNYIISERESILDCLLRNGVEYPHSCQAGICQSCLIKSSGHIETAWQEGIQDALKAQGYFLACLAYPKHSLNIFAPNSNECSVNASIYNLKKLSHNVLQVKLSVKDLTSWTPGQYLNLVNPYGLIRSYSIANIPMQDGFIELHIKLYEHGLMSRWFQEEAQENANISIRGPLGKSFYFNPKKLSYNMLLAGTGTGLAPLIAIVRDALRQEHSGEITLLHGGITHQDLYYIQELTKLTTSYPQFHYESCILNNDVGPSESIENKMLSHINDGKNLNVFICGPEVTTNQLKIKAFCAGVSSSNIFSDAFL
jgi:NAD(P)H-flavin reductase/ferredoxin